MSSGLIRWTIAVAVLSMVLCTIGVILRLITRLKFADKRLEIEDWLVVGAYILCMGIACTIIVATTFGMGSHIDQGISKEQITKLLKTLFALRAPLFLTLALIRTSLLLFIRRLAKTSSRTLYLITTSLIPGNIIGAFVTFNITVFRCTPISSMWTPGTQNVRCIGPKVSYFLIAFGLAVDLAIFIIPAILVIRINITPHKKLQSIAMFAMGAAGCIIESLRFNQVYVLETSPDVTYNLGIVNIFIFLQVILGMLCCCAPAARLMIIWIIDTKLKRTMSTTQLRFSSGDTNASTGDQSIYWQSVRDDVESTLGHPSEQISKLPKDLGQSYDNENIEMTRRESVIDGEATTRVGEKIMNPKEIMTIK